MAQSKNKQIAQDQVRQKVAELYQKLRGDAARTALSTFGALDPDLEQLDEELTAPEE